jgi:hypothetical protein
VTGDTEREVRLEELSQKCGDLVADAVRVAAEVIMGQTKSAGC